VTELRLCSFIVMIGLLSQSLVCDVFIVNESQNCLSRTDVHISVDSVSETYKHSLCKCCAIVL